ncbi:MAG: hypothetical protein AAB890_01585 [Patescibacteria group bacterium]
MFRAIVTIFFLAGAVTIFFIKSQPIFNETKNLREQVIAFDNALADARKIKETKDELIAKYNDISQSDIDRIDKLVPSQTDAIKFIMEVDDIIKNNGMILRSIDVKNAEGSKAPPDAGGKSKLFETVSFAMKIAGSYESFFSFVKNMEENLRLTDINAVKLSPAIGSLYEFDVEASAYFKPTKEQLRKEQNEE